MGQAVLRPKSGCSVVSRAQSRRKHNLARRFPAKRAALTRTPPLSPTPFASQALQQSNRTLFAELIFGVAVAAHAPSSINASLLGVEFEDLCMT
jgi:hypothetical protein